MSTELDLLTIGRAAAEDLSDDQYRFVVLTSSDTFRRPDSTKEYAHGVLQNVVESGKECDVRVHGYTKIEAGEALAVGDYVAPEYVSASDAGKATKTGDLRYARGFVVEAADAEGDLAGIFLFDKDLSGSVQMYIPANAGDTDVKHPIFRAPHKMKVLAVYAIFQTALTGADTNFVTPTVINAGTAGSGTDVIASKAYTSGVDAAALVPEALTLSGTPANLVIAEGDVLAYLSDMSGSSVNDDNQKVIQVAYQRMPENS